MIYLVTASFDLTVRIWGIDERELVRIFYFDSPVLCFDINEVGQILVTGDEKGLVTVWEVNKGYVLKKFYFEQEKETLRSPLRGINLSFDEETVLIHDDHCLAYYDFSPFK